jgi:hypothetical protein
MQLLDGQRTTIQNKHQSGNVLPCQAELPFSARAPSGSMARTRVVDGFDLSRNADKKLLLPITDLAEVLGNAAQRRGGRRHQNMASPFPRNCSRDGWPTGRIQQDREGASHGLRKTLGKRPAEGGASTPQLMDVLGHHDIEHAEL